MGSLSTLRVEFGVVATGGELPGRVVVAEFQNAREEDGYDAETTSVLGQGGKTRCILDLDVESLQLSGMLLQVQEGEVAVERHLDMHVSFVAIWDDALLKVVM